MGDCWPVALFLAYLLGGVTFLPLLVWTLWVWGTIDIAHARQGEERHAHDQSGVEGGLNGLDREDDKERDGLGIGIAGTLLEGLKGRKHIPDVASGFFAVCREYVPGGWNGKPPERTTPAGAVVATESPSVYQSMYRSIFDRNKTFGPSMDATNGKSKKARNVFYVVLRYVSIAPRSATC